MLNFLWGTYGGDAGMQDQNLDWLSSFAENSPHWTISPPPLGMSFTENIVGTPLEYVINVLSK